MMLSLADHLARIARARAATRQAVLVRVVEYTVPGRDPGQDGELICLITTIMDVRDGPAVKGGYHLTLARPLVVQTLTGLVTHRTSPR